MAGRLEGKVALISGGAGGCGLAATELLPEKARRSGSSICRTARGGRRRPLA